MEMLDFGFYTNNTSSFFSFSSFFCVHLVTSIPSRKPKKTIKIFYSTFMIMSVYFFRFFHSEKNLLSNKINIIHQNFKIYTYAIHFNNTSESSSLNHRTNEKY